MTRPDATTRPAARSAATARERGFTTLELLVAVAILTMVIFSVREIFDISTETALRTGAHAELIESSAAFHKQVAAELDKIYPGLLIIECPAPTQARMEISGGERLFRLRHDRLVFITSGGPDAYQSATDPTRGTDDGPATGSDALVYFGPGMPMTYDDRAAPFYDDGAPLSVALTASEWVYLHRTILLLLEDPHTPPNPNWTPPDMTTAFTSGSGMLNDGNLYDGFLFGSMDAVVSSGSDRADAATLVDLIQDKVVSDLMLPTPPFAALWAPSWAPMSASLASQLASDYYTRSNFNFERGMADIRIAWTDGRRVDPLGPDGLADTGDEDYRTRWFGLLPDGASTPNLSSAATVNSSVFYFASRRQDVPEYAPGSYADSTAEEIIAFRDRIEWSNPSNANSATNAAYRAVWRADTWQHRPKALRFTYRLYDTGNRLRHVTEVDLDDDGLSDPESGRPREVTRFGQEFSVIVAVP